MLAPSPSLLDENHALATFGNLVLLLWGRETTTQGIAGLQRTATELAKFYPEGIVLLTVVGEDSQPPSSLARAALAQVMRGLTVIKRSAVVFEGVGFGAAMVRGVVTGLQLLQRFPFPHKIFSTAEDAVVWLGSRMTTPSGTPIPKTEVLAALHVTRVGFDQRRGKVGS